MCISQCLISSMPQWFRGPQGWGWGHPESCAAVRAPERCPGQEKREVDAPRHHLHHFQVSYSSVRGRSWHKVPSVLIQVPTGHPQTRQARMRPGQSPTLPGRVQLNSQGGTVQSSTLSASLLCPPPHPLPGHPSPCGHSCYTTASWY